MAKSNISSGGGKWTMPAASAGAPAPTSKPKSGMSRNMASANKHASTAPGDFGLAASLSSKNKHHGG